MQEHVQQLRTQLDLTDEADAQRVLVVASERLTQVTERLGTLEDQLKRREAEELTAEAMRAGKAIVATDVGGNTESVRDGQEALIVKPADIDGLSAALERLADDAGLRTSLGEAAYKRFCADFTVEAMLNKTARWMQDVCAE